MWERFGWEGGAQETEGAGVLFFNSADSDAEAVGNFAMGKEFDFAQEEDGATACREVGNRLFEKSELLAGHGLLGNARCGRGGRFMSGIGGASGAFGRDAAALEAVDSEPAGGDVEKRFGFFGALVFDGRIDAEVGVVRDILSFGCIAKEAR
jgi:hypothetical protein